MARILLLTPQLPYPPHQGTTIRNYNLLVRLARQHTIDLLTLVSPGAEAENGSGREPMIPAEIAGCCRQVVVEPQPGRTLARRARDTVLNPLPDMALRLVSPALHAAMRRLLAENEYDVIQVEGIEMEPYVLGLTRSGKRGPRLVFDDHNAEYVLQRRAFRTDILRPRRWLAAVYSGVQWRKLMAYERRACQAADRVVAVSEPDKDALQRLLPGQPVTVVPNGVDLDFYRPGVVPPLAGLARAALVFTGKMDYRPNVDAVLWFVEAVLPRVRAQAPEAHFYVVGQQPHPRLASLAQHPAVTVTGRVPDVRPYLAGAAAYVVPLRIGGGTRLKVLEAMAMGRPLVSTRLGCDGFPFEDGRELRLADTPEAFAAAVVGLLRRRDEAEALGRAARARVAAHYGWDAIVPQMEDLYR